MAVLAKLLESGCLSQSRVEEAGYQKLAAQIIFREFQEADEANLLDEEDMHVYGLKPMDDPLDLVCCNACKKPVKASQYAAHAEICQSLNSVQESILGLNGATGHKKHLKKEKKKMLAVYSNRDTQVLEQEKYELMNGDGTCASGTQLDRPARANSSYSVLAKNGASVKSGTRISAGATNQSAFGTAPPAEWSKLMADKSLPPADNYKPNSVITDIINQEAFNYVPVPLATRIYYSQRNSRLRSAINYQYWETAGSSNALSGYKWNQPLTEEFDIPVHASSQDSFNQNNDLQNTEQNAGSPHRSQMEVFYFDKNFLLGVVIEVSYFPLDLYKTWERGKPI